MDHKKKILLGETKNINSINVDTFLLHNIKNKKKKLIEYNITHFVDSSGVFESEREEKNTYRIYGVIEYLSLLNRLPNDYDVIGDFFIKKTGFYEDVKTLLNSFDIFLLKPSDEYGELDNAHEKRFEVIATPNELNIIDAGFSTNIFLEPKYYFDFQIDFIRTEKLDGIGFPITELYLYFQYKPVNEEGLYYKKINQTNGDFDFDFVQHPLTNWLIGDVLSDNDDYICEIIKHNEKEYRYENIVSQQFQIKTEIEHNSENKEILWVYNPILPIRLSYLSSTLSRANKNSTSYQQKTEIPHYATDLDSDGNVIWRELQPDSYFDPNTGEGVDHPFLNGCKYVFNNIIFSVSPDLDDETTKEIFDEIKFDDPKTISQRPVNDNLDNIAKPCQ